MIKHLFKLAWNRKRSNYLIMLEIFFSYLVLFSVVILTIYYLDNYRKPLGFDYKNVWTIDIKSRLADDDKTRENKKIVFKQLLNGLAELSEIESFCGIGMPPFGNNDSWGTYTNVKSGKQYPLHFNDATDDLNKVLNLKIISGRWFGKADDGAAYIPVVINKRAAEGIFGDDDPIGKDIWNPKGKNKPKSEETLQREERVVGIIDDFRKSGELSELSGYRIARTNLDDTNKTHPTHMLGNILIRVRPGTTQVFEEKVIKRLQSEVKDWSFEIKPLEQMRETSFRETLMPLYAFAIIAGFLLIMVALGLTGVLWLSVTRRTKEMGLRRACGAARKKIHKQILGELFVISTISLTAAILIVVQFPLLSILVFVDTNIYTVSVIVSALLIYALIAICGLYPSKMATKIHPADALHYE